MDLVISIVSWNTRDLLRTCLRSLGKHCGDGRTRVIVVDNASSDGSAAMVREEFPDVTVVESGGNLGFGKAHNLIAARSSEPFVLFLNPDSEFVESAHAGMLEVFRQHPEVGAVGCQLTNLDGSVQPLGIQWPTSPWTELVGGLLVSRHALWLTRNILPSQDPHADGFVRKLYGGCLMVRREVLDEAGWFDERFFMYGEDVDLSRRIEMAGWRLYYLSSKRVIHLCAGASAKAPGRFATLMQCESIEKLMGKYYGRPGRFCYACAILARALPRVLLVGAARTAFHMMGRETRALDDAWLKNLSLLKWTFGLARAVVPK